MHDVLLAAAFLAMVLLPCLFTGAGNDHDEEARTQPVATTNAH